MVYGSKSGPLDLGLGVYVESSIPDHTKFDQHLQMLIPWCGWSWFRTTCIWVGYANCDTCERCAHDQVVLEELEN